MKNVAIYITFLLFTFSYSFAQSPNKISYQAVIRNSSDQLIKNTSIGMRISILQNAPNGPAVYREIYNPNVTTNQNGLVSFEIGGGIPVEGSFSSINWASGTYFIQTEADPAGGSNYTINSVAPVNSVPYALYAASGNKGDKGDPGNTGAQCPQGIKGDTGGTGPQGIKGDTGDTGPQGNPGNTGAQGPQGLKGDTGNTGAQGPQGLTGNQGPQGLQGPQGIQGPIGLTGPQGPPGNSQWTTNGANIYYNTGNVGIGTSNPVHKMHIVGDMRLTGGLFFGTGEKIYDGGINTIEINSSFVPNNNTRDLGKTDQRWNNLFISGDILFGTIESLSDGGANTIESNSHIIPFADNSRSLGKSGNRWTSVWATDGSINTSDARLKQEIQPISTATDQLMKLKPVTYFWKNARADQGKEIGFLAQDLLEVVPEAVVTQELETDENGVEKIVPVKNLGVKYHILIPVLTRAIQEQQKIIGEQQMKIDELSRRLLTVEQFISGKNKVEINK